MYFVYFLYVSSSFSAKKTGHISPSLVGSPHGLLSKSNFGKLCSFSITSSLRKNHAPKQQCKLSYMSKVASLILHRTDTSLDLKVLSKPFSWSYFFPVRVHPRANHLRGQRLAAPGSHINRIKYPPIISTATGFRKIPTACFSPLYPSYLTQTKLFSTSRPSTMPIVTSLTKALGIRVCVSFPGGYWACADSDVVLNLMRNLVLLFKEGCNGMS